MWGAVCSGFNVRFAPRSKGMMCDPMSFNFFGSRHRFDVNRFKFDLHGYTLIDANEKVKELILFCVKKKFKEILLITGKGIHSNTSKDVYISNDLSKLKFSVPEYIRSNSEISESVTSITPANNSEGGDGAIIIRLK